MKQVSPCFLSSNEHFPLDFYFSFFLHSLSRQINCAFGDSNSHCPHMTDLSVVTSVKEKIACLLLIGQAVILAPTWHFVSWMVPVY